MEKPETEQIEQISRVPELLKIARKHRRGIFRGADKNGIAEDLNNFSDEELRVAVPLLEAMRENEISLSIMNINPMGGPMISNTDIIADIRNLLEALEEKLS